MKTTMDEVQEGIDKEFALTPAQEGLRKRIDILLEDMKGKNGDAYGKLGRDLMTAMLTSENGMMFVFEALAVIPEPEAAALALVHFGYLLGKLEAK
jgi:hypothetical protein